MSVDETFLEKCIELAKDVDFKVGFFYTPSTYPPNEFFMIDCKIGEKEYSKAFVAYNRDVDVEKINLFKMLYFDKDFGSFKNMAIEVEEDSDG